MTFGEPTVSSAVDAGSDGTARDRLKRVQEANFLFAKRSTSRALPYLVFQVPTQGGSAGAAGRALADAVQYQWVFVQLHPELVFGYDVLDMVSHARRVASRSTVPQV